MLFFKQNPFVRFFCFAFVGVFGAYYLNVDSSFLPYLAVSALLLIALSLYFLFTPRFYQSYRFRWISSLLVGIAFVVVFAVYFQVRQAKPIKKDGFFKFKGIVEEVVSVNDSVVRLSVLVSQFDNDSLILKGSMKTLISTKKFKGQVDSIYGCELIGKGYLSSFKSVDIPFQFDYGQYLLRNGYVCQLNAYQIDSIKLGPPLTFSTTPFVWMRNHFKSQMKFGLKDLNEQGVVQALILGDRSMLGCEIRNAYVRAGAIHILAVSGMHVGIIYLALSWVLAFLKSRKVIYVFVCLVVLWFYALLTGSSPSVLRATIMFSVIIIGQASNRQTSIYNLLSLSAFIIAIINPNHLFNLGFWLSHLAVLGIVMFYKSINDFIEFRFIILRWGWSIVAVSLAAQVFTFPLMLMFFNGFPIYFILANIMVLPVISFIMIGALFMALLPVNSFMFKMIAGAVSDLVSYINTCAIWISDLYGSYANWLSMNLFEVILFFTIVILLVVYYQNRHIKLLWQSISCGVILFFSLSYRVYTSSNSCSIIFQSRTKGGFVNLNMGRNSFVFAPNERTLISSANNLYGYWGQRFIYPPYGSCLDTMKSSFNICWQNRSCTFYPLKEAFLNKVKSLPINDKQLLVCVEPEFEMLYSKTVNSKTPKLHLIGMKSSVFLTDSVKNSLLSRGYLVEKVTQPFWADFDLEF